MPETDLALLEAAARRAGDIATGFFGRAPQVWDKPDAAGPVTEADLAVNAQLLDTLHHARPDYGWLSEETEDGPARLATIRQFIIDPIDGTRAFIDGSRDWSHSLAVAEAGQIVAAAVYLPLRDMMYLAAVGQGATLNGKSLAANADPQLDRARILSARPNFDGHHWKAGKPPLATRHFRSSIAYRLCLVAEGRFDAMITLRPTWEWDIAAGSLIVQEAGGQVTDQNGAAVRFNARTPQAAGLVAGGAAHAGLLAALTPGARA